MTELRRRVVTGFFWTMLQTGMSRCIALLTTLVLLRYLSERDFGLLSAALVVMNAIEAFSDAGLTKELIYRKDRFEEACHTAFTLLLLLNAALFGLVLLAGPAIAAFTKDPEVVRIVNWISLGLIISGAGMVPLAVLQRNMMFRQTAVREIAAQLIAGATAVGMALWGMGVMSLVARQLAGLTAGLVLAWWICPYRPKLRIDRDLARSMFGYGKHMVAASLLTILVYNADRVVGVRLVGIAALGFYAVGMTVAELPPRLVSRAASQVLFPVFSRMQDDRAAVGRGYLKAIRTIGALLLPAQFALAVLAPSLLEALYGDKWAITGQLLPYLAAYGLFLGLTLLAGEVFKATGNPAYVSFYSTVHLLALVALLIGLGAWLGLPGLALATASAMGLRFILETRQVARMLQVPPLKIVAGYLRPLLCSAAAFLAVAFLMGRPAGLVQVVLWTLGGGAIYAASMWVIDRSFFLEALEVLRLGRSAA